MPNITARYIFILLFPALLALAACNGTAATVTKTDHTPIPHSPYIRLSLVPPPEAPFEEAELPADPLTEIWRPGFWEYNDGSFSWHAGALMPRPSPTAIWMPDHWEKRVYGWAFVPGYWQ